MMKKIFFFFVAFTVLLGFDTFAGHTLGGQITYKFVSGTTYKVRLTLYTDCSGIDPVTPSFPNYFCQAAINNGTIPAGTALSTTEIRIQRLDGTGDCNGTGTLYSLDLQDTNIASEVCSNVLTTCNGGATPGVREWILEKDINFGVGNRFEIWWNTCCRGPNIINYASNLNQTVHTTMFKGLHPTNSTPVIRNLKIPFICPNKPPNCYQLNAIDAPTNSILQYELVTTTDNYLPPTTPVVCFTNPFPYDPTPTTPNTYNAGFSPINPFGVGPLPCLNELSGVLTIPTILTTGTYVVVIKITEYNTATTDVMSIIYRDFLITVNGSICTNATQLDCTFAPPVVSPPAISLADDTLKICQGDLFNVCLNLSNSNQIIFIDNANFLPYSSTDNTWIVPLVSGNGTANLNVCLSGVVPSTAGSFDIFIDVKSGCPLPSLRTIKFHVIVIKSTFITPVDDPIIKCGQDAIGLKASGGQTYIWRDISNGPPQDIDCDNCDSVNVAPIVTTTYVVESFPQVAGSACKYKDTVQVKVAPDFLITTSANDNKVCFGTPVQITSSVSLPQNGFKYKWKRLNDFGLPVNPLYLSNDSIFNPTTIVAPFTPASAITPVGVYTYEIEATSPDGCKRKDEIVVNVTQEKPPIFSLTQSQKLFCSFNGNASISANAVFTNIPPVVSGCKVSPSDPCFGNPSDSLGPRSGSSSTSSSTQPGMFAGTQKITKQQYLFTIPELAVAGMPNKGKISSIYFYVDNLVPDANKDYKTYSNVTIKIGCTSLNSLSGLAIGSAFSTVPSVTVYSKPLRIVKGWNEIKFLSGNGTGTLIQAYEYDGASITPNFMIDVTSTVATATPNTFPQVQLMSSFFTSSVFNSGTTAPATILGSSSSKPNFKFKFCGTSPLDNTVNTFNWTSNLPSATFDNTTNANPTIIFSQPGTYNLNCEVTTASKACKENQTIQVFVRPKVNFDFTQLAPYLDVCNNSNGFNLLYYVKPKINTSFSGTPITNSILGTFNPSQAVIGNNSIQMTVQDSAQFVAFPGGPPCQVSETININVDAFKSATILNKGILSNNYCEDDKIAYQLDVKLPQVGVFNGALSTSGSFVPFTAGSGIKKLYYTTPSPCGDKDSMEVKINALPTVNINLQENNLCIPITVRVNATTNPGTGFYKWHFNSGLDSSASQSVDIKYETVLTDNIQLQFKDAFGCIAKASKTITTLAKPKASFTASPKSTSTLYPNINFENTSIEVANTTIQYTWNIGNLSEIYGKDATYNFEQNPGYHTISLLAKSSNGCEDLTSESFNISVDYALFVPTAFNPTSGSGFENRKLMVKSLGVQKDFIKFQVYDRTGAKVFESLDFNNNWNGKVNNEGAYCQPGVYVWRATIKDVSNKEYELNGSTILIK
jgi:CHU_C Type IX secretion signal domain